MQRLALLLLLTACGPDDIDVSTSIPSVWISVTGNTIIVHNQSSITLDLSNGRLTEKVGTQTPVHFTIPAMTQVQQGNTVSFNGTTIGFSMTCLNTPTIFLYNKSGKLIDDASCL